MNYMNKLHTFLLLLTTEEVTTATLKVISATANVILTNEEVINTLNNI